jgi:hypothetical protein
MIVQINKTCNNFLKLLRKKAINKTTKVAFYLQNQYQIIQKQMNNNHCKQKKKN